MNKEKKVCTFDLCAFLIKHSFKKIGEYSWQNNKVECKYKAYDVKKTEVLSLVYAMVIDNCITYIGYTTQGYKRPLGYHKNNVMKKVKTGIENACRANKTVTIYARSTLLTHTIEDLELDISQAIEQALISQYQKLLIWNSHVKKKKAK